MSAVAQRERRKTAGQRMTSLVGKAQEEDDAFWGHDTWAEEDSGNDSFRESDEDSEHRKDTFDSDFDDSESDHEDEEAAAGEEEERELQRNERGNRQKKSNYVDIAKGGRALMPKTKGFKGKGNTKRAVGSGINAGIVLNLPPPSVVASSSAVPPSAAAVGSAAVSTQPLAPPALVPSSAAVAHAPTHQSTSSSASPLPKKSRMTAELGVRPTLASGRERRSQTRKRDSRNAAPTYSDAAASSTAQPSNKKLKPQTGAPTRKSKRRQYAQEELLLEAIKDTEPENQRWLLARKRVQDSADQDRDSLAALREKHRGKNVVQKYHSRRGCLITLTFPEMDAVPELLTRKSEPLTKPEPMVCAITGKPARYRDPKTNQGYYDATAFKELRRRDEAGLPLDQRPKTKPKPKPKPKSAAPTKKDKETLVSGSTHSTPSSAPTQQQPKSPSSSSGFVVDLGGAQKSPGSTRSSGRKWKPSEKMIQGMGHLKREEGVKNGNVPSVSSDQVATDTVIASAPPLPSMTTTAKVETVETTTAASEEASSKTNGGKNGSAKVVIKKPPSTKPTATGKSATTTELAMPPSKPTTASSAGVSSEPEKKSPDETKPQTERIYIIPHDGENGLTEPRYVTQSELIMQAISKYSRSLVGGDATLSSSPDAPTPTTTTTTDNNNKNANKGE